MGTGLTHEERREIIHRNGGKKENILGMLLDFQRASAEGCVDAETAAFLAGELGMTPTRVYEIASYYAMLSVKPQARYVLQVCNSAPCHFSGAEAVAGMLKRALGVDLAQPTEDGMFVYHYTPCVGACDVGPVIKLGEAVYGNLNEEKVRRLIEDLRAGNVRG